MSGKKQFWFMLGAVISACLVTAAVSAAATAYFCSEASFQLLDMVCSKAAESAPQAKGAVLAALKECVRGEACGTGGESLLEAFGYGAADIAVISQQKVIWGAAAGVLTGILLAAAVFFYRDKMENKRIGELTGQLERVNSGKAMVLSAAGEDRFSRLEDEIYKTVTFLRQTRDEAVQAKQDFAENLSNIAHQIKTPITAMSLAVQEMEACSGTERIDECAPRCTNVFFNPAEKELSCRIKKQLARLDRLEGALLLLAKLDAGTLVFREEKTDVFTLLVLAADELWELCRQSGVSIEIPELEGMAVMADPDWTTEAILNLMKNCMEHSAGGSVRCSCAQNPLYTEILICDEGDGFAKEDIPHLFERFYRGKNAKEGGIGIGLALAREIIERQNGTLRAKNMPEGGACFEIRFYRH